MTHSRTFRVLFVGSLTTAIILVVAMTCWLVLWPEWQRHRRVQSLIAQFNDLGNEQEAVAALAQLGVDAVPALIRLLEDPSKIEDRTWAIVTLRTIGPDAKDALPVLIKILNEPSESGRSLAAETIGVIGPNVEGIRAMAAASRDEADYVRCGVELGFAHIGPRNKKLVPALIEALDEPNATISAAHALARFGSDAETAIPRLTESLSDDDPTIRVSAARGIWLIQGPSDDLVEYLLAGLTADDTTCRQHAAWAVHDIGPAARWAIPILLETLSDKKVYIRMAKVEAILAIDRQYATAAIPILLELRDDRLYGRRVRQLLEEIAPEANGPGGGEVR